MATLTWLHFSDLHMTESGVASLDLERAAQDVKDQLARWGLRLDFVAFTGDLAWSGKSAEYRQVERSLRAVINTLQVDPERLFLVPGNHDIDRLIGTDDPILKPPHNDAAVSALIMEENIPETLKNRQKAYLEFLERFRENDPCYLADPTSLFGVHNLKLGDDGISILCLNTAWLSTGDNDKGQLAVGEPQIARAVKLAKYATRIGLMHHPFSWLRDHEELVVHREIARKCQFILTGHQHYPRFGDAAFGDGARLLSAGAIHLPSRMLSYNIVHLDTKRGYGNVHVRLFTGLTPDWVDLDLSPHARKGQVRIKRKNGIWTWNVLTKSKRPIPSRSEPELRYANLYQIASRTFPYIVLVSSFQPGINEYRYGDVEVKKAMNGYSLPNAFRHIQIRPVIASETKCRMERFEWIASNIRPFRIGLTLSEINYGDYLKSGEHLDDPLPDQPGKTFRDEYAPPSVIRTPESCKLTNICGVGLFIITRDEKIIVSENSKGVAVFPERWSYSASGTMDWGKTPHPFSEAARECREEIGHEPNLDEVRLFEYGIDAKKFYFQFSFFERSARSANEILTRAIHARDYSFEKKQVIAIPFDLDTVTSRVKDRNWEPAAAASLVTLCAKKFGLDEVERRIDSDYMQQRLRDEMAAEWQQRAARDGDFAVMSARYPSDRVELESRKYAEAVVSFIGGDLDGKDVLEMGCGAGRITKHLVGRVAKLTCLDLSAEMIEVNRKGLKEDASRITYLHMFGQDFHADHKYDAVLCSLVLIHNVDEQLFQRLVRVLRECAPIVFLFEHVDPVSPTSAYTRPRAEQRLCHEFAGFQIERRKEYAIFDDQIIFLKLLAINH
jgi:SAM-dependent methyltransferase/predicted MPP superfamily phosphohydrolase